METVNKPARYTLTLVVLPGNEYNVNFRDKHLHLANRAKDGPASSLLTYYPKSLEALSPDLVLAFVLAPSFETGPMWLSLYPIFAASAGRCPLCANGCRIRPSTAATIRILRARPVILALLTESTSSMYRRSRRPEMRLKVLLRVVRSRDYSSSLLSKKIPMTLSPTTNMSTKTLFYTLKFTRSQVQPESYAKYGLRRCSLLWN